MNFTLIKGCYYVIGYSPDGDSIKFKADNPALWDTLITEFREELNESLAEDNGIVTLRLQGIDAFETHYTPETPTPPKGFKAEPRASIKKPDPGNHKQPKRIAIEATNVFMNLLGVEEATWKSWGKNSWVNKITLRRGDSTVELSEKHADAIPGYIVTNDAEKKGRPIAWVFPGTTSLPDGTMLSTEELAAMLDQSANYHLLRQGVVYPYFFMTLPAKLRQKMADAAQKAQRDAARRITRLKGKPVPDTLSNLWLYDQTVNGIDIDDLKHITEDFGIYPYLFRRIIKHWYATQMQRYWNALISGDEDKAQYDQRLDLSEFFEGSNPYVFIISDQDFVRLSQIVVIEGRRLTLRKYPFDIVFLS
ncbi:MAG: nuclease [Anaerolineae bacterium]